MLKRASSHLKGMATGFVNKAISGVSGITSGFAPSISCLLYTSPSPRD